MKIISVIFDIYFFSIFDFNVNTSPKPLSSRIPFWLVRVSGIFQCALAQIMRKILFCLVTEKVYGTDCCYFPAPKIVQDVLSLGFSSQGEIFEVLNFCILNAKYYIHNKRLLNDNNVEFLYIRYVKRTKLHKHLTHLYSYMTKCDTNIYFS